MTYYARSIARWYVDGWWTVCGASMVRSRANVGTTSAQGRDNLGTTLGKILDFMRSFIQFCRYSILFMYCDATWCKTTWIEIQR